MQPDLMLELPLELSSFVGRDHELLELRLLLDRTYLLTLIGPPGVGKSRLAARTAAEYGAASGQRVVRVDFAETTSSAQIAALLQSVRGLRMEQLFILLDNCDHALPACRRFVTAVVGTCPGVKLLATSRERIGATAETVWLVDPLPVPPPGADVAAIAASASVALFVRRARDINASFTLTEANAADIARICRDVDGLPLAIELAAARTSVMTVRHVAERLDTAIRLYPGGHRPRSRMAAFGASLEWTIARLSMRERRLLWDLSVFNGSWDVPSAQAVCTDPTDRIDVLPLLTRLVSCSFVRKLDQQRGTDVRYAMLNVIRRYAAHQLDLLGRSQGVRRRHAEWYRRTAESIPFGSGRADVLERLSLEQPNFLAALAWAVSASEVDLALSLANVLHGLWYIDGHFSESRAWFDKVLALPGGSPAARAMVMNWASNHATAQGDVSAALAWSDKVRAAAAELHDPVLRTIGLDGFASILWDQGNLRCAEAVLLEELELCRNLGLSWLQCGVLFRLARIQVEYGHLDYAHELAEQALVCLGEDGNVWMQVRILDVLGCVALERGDFRTAGEHLTSALANARLLEDVRGTTEVLIDMAQLEFRCGNGRLTRRLIAEALDVCEHSGETLALLRILDVIVMLRALTRPEAVLHLAGAVTALRLRHQAARLPREQARYDAALETALGELRQTTGATALAAGQTLSRQAAAALGRDLLEAGEAGVRGSSDAEALLTPRELQIAKLLSRGLTNRAIGSELFVSEGTVRAHVEHILGKLGLRSRVQVAARLADEDGSGATSIDVNWT